MRYQFLYTNVSSVDIGSELQCVWRKEVQAGAAELPVRWAQRSTQCQVAYICVVCSCTVS